MLKFFNDRQLRQDLKSNTNLYLFFYSPSCGPCKSLYPEVIKFGEETNHIVHMVYEDEAVELQKQLNITAYPSIVRIKNGKIILAGLGENEVKKIIKDGKSN